MRITRLWMGALAILGLAGCGGGGTPQANLTLQVVDGANEGYVVASQVGNAVWTQVRVDFGTKSIPIALGNNDRYGVAVRCLGNNQVYLIQATRSEVDGAQGGVQPDPLHPFQPEPALHVPGGLDRRRQSRRLPPRGEPIRDRIR